MPVMTTKDFINVVFVHQAGELTSTHPYIAFIVMGIGIEFLGKCINIAALDWHEERVSRIRFEGAINSIKAFEKYRPLIGKGSQFDLYGSLRCGLAHAAAPKYPITLSSKNEMGNLVLHDNGQRMNLKCEDFYTDFRGACEEVLNAHYEANDKMNQPFLAVPDYPIDPDAMKSAITESKAPGNP